MYLTTKHNINQEYIVLAAGAVAAVIIILGFYNAMFKPTLNKLASVSKKIKKGQVIAPDAEGYRRQYSGLEEKIDNLRGQISYNKEKLFWKKDVTLFIKELSRIAEELDVDFISINPRMDLETIMSEDGETVLMFKNPININMRAQHEELISFLKRVEDSDKFLRIDSIDISVDKKDISRRNITMILSIFSAD